MIIYLDPSVIVSLFVSDALSSQAHTILRSSRPQILVSDFACAEFCSAIARKVRMRELTLRDAQDVFGVFDEWIERDVTRIGLTSSDVAMTIRYLRRLNTSLRTPDALHVAIAQRVGATLLTFDSKLASAAEALGVQVAST